MTEKKMKVKSKESDDHVTEGLNVKGYVKTVWAQRKQSKIRIEDEDGVLHDYFTVSNDGHDRILATAISALNGNFKVQLFHSDDERVTSLAHFSVRFGESGAESAEV